MAFVLDNSIAMRWLLNDRDAATQDYARRVLELLEQGDTAIVPNLWALEAANVITKGLYKGTIMQADASQFLGFLDELDIEVDTLTHERALGATLHLANQYHLSSYDAAYLELALRKGLMLATVDQNLAEALGKSGGVRLLMN